MTMSTSFNVGAIKVLDYRNQSFLPVKTSVTVPTRRLLLVKASQSSRDNGPIKKLGLTDAECEAAVVAGNVPEAPPVPPAPAAPAGTPSISPLRISRRPRRNRGSPVLRSAFQETSLSPANFVYPLFIHEGEEDTPIGAMPGCYRLGWRHGLIEEVGKARDVGVNSIVLFPKVPDALKTPTGDEAYNDNGLVPRTIRLLKDKYPDLELAQLEMSLEDHQDALENIYRNLIKTRVSLLNALNC